MHKVHADKWRQKETCDGDGTVLNNIICASQRSVRAPTLSTTLEVIPLKVLSGNKGQSMYR